MRFCRCVVILVILAILGASVLGSGIGSAATSQPWWKGAVISDSFHYMPWMQSSASMSAFKQLYAINGMPNTVAAYADYREWMPWPAAWSQVSQQIAVAHGASLPIGVISQFNPSDCADTPVSEACGFLYIYQNLTSPWWPYPNGTLAKDPYSQGATREFNGSYDFEIIGQAFGRRDFSATMQPQDTYYLHFLEQWVEMATSLGADGVAMDNVNGVFPLFSNGGWGCNDTWEGVGFQNYLSAHYNTAQLTSMGITNTSNFCMSDYIATHYRINGIGGGFGVARGAFSYAWPSEEVQLSNSSALMNDPVVRAFIVYQYTSLESFFGNFTSAVNAYSSSIERQVLLTTNGYETWVPETNSPQGVTGIILTPYFNVDAVERSDFALPPFQGDAAVCKTALAAVNYSKPVWVYNGDGLLWDSNLYSQPTAPQNASAFVETKVAEAYADGCLRLVPVNAGTQQEGWPQHRLVNGSEVGPMSEYYSFIQNNSALFTTPQSSSAKVALVYSVPDVVWNYFPTFGMDASNYKPIVGGWARALELSHVPYDIILLGMNGVYQPAELSGLLGKYNVVIAPGAENVPNADLSAIENFVANGGKLITTSNFAAFDDMHNPRNGSSLSSLFSNSNVEVISSGPAYDLQSALQENVIDQTALGEIQSALFSVMPPDDIVRTNAPQTVMVSPMMQDTSQWMVIHLVNYDYGYNSSTDWSSPTGPIELNVTLPQGLTVTGVELLSPDSPRNQTNLAYSVSHGDLTLTVPNLRTWDLVVINPSAVITPAQSTTTSTTLTSGASTRSSTTTVSTSNTASGISTAVRTTEQASSSQNRTTASSVQRPTSTTVILEISVLGGVVVALVAIYAIRRWRFSPAS